MTESMNRGMECLTEAPDIVAAEEFISPVIRERFDYTKWQRDYFDQMQPGEFHARALDYAARPPWNGRVERL